MNLKDMEEFIDTAVRDVWTTIRQDVEERDAAMEYADEVGMPDWEGMTNEELAADIGDHLLTACIDIMEHSWEDTCSNATS